MQQAANWTVLNEIEEDGPISELSAQRVRANAPAGCLICAIESDDQWSDDQWNDDQWDDDQWDDE